MRRKENTTNTGKKYNIYINGYKNNIHFSANI
jgi:hypothetical protein